MSEKTAIEKMVEYLDSSASIGASRSENIRIAKRLASLEAKPTANADLVGELTQVLEDWEINGNPMQKLELEAILSKYRPVPVVKEQGEAGLMKKEHLNYECEMAIPKEERERRLENKECLDCYKRLTSTPAPVASGLVKELKDNIEKAMKGITERQTQEDSYWRGYYNCLEETWDSLNVQISRYSKEAK